MSVRVTQVANPTTGGPPVGVRCRVGYVATFIAMLATLAVVALGSTTPRAAAAPRAAPTLAGTWQALPPAAVKREVGERARAAAIDTLSAHFRHTSRERRNTVQW